MRLRRLHLASTLLAAAALAAPLAAAASTSPAFHLATARLYAVQHPGQGRPVAYVVFSGAPHQHEPRLVVAKVAGTSGRTYLFRTSGPNCYRASFIHQSALVKAGRAYTVTFSTRKSPTSHTYSPLTHRKLTAHALASDQRIPGC
jgi:hypothetical protein